MTSYIAVFLASAALIWWLWSHETAPIADLALIAAGMGFITRDVALFVLLHALPGRRRGDFTAALLLFALYLLIPAILNGLGLGASLVFFYPKPTAPVWLAPAFAWAEAAVIVTLALGRIALSDKGAAGESAGA